MGKAQRQRGPQKKKGGGAAVVKWVAIVAVLGGIGYGVSQMSSVAFDEDDIKVVNFQGLTSKQKQQALEAANSARCSCGCGLGLAQCVSTDPNCPIRESNIERIKGMVRAASLVGLTRPPINAATGHQSSSGTEGLVTGPSAADTCASAAITSAAFSPIM